MVDEKTSLATKIVAAYLIGNTVAATSVPDLIRAAHAALSGSASPIPEPAVRPQPFVSVKKSVTPDAIICLDCGKPQKMLKRHLGAAHGLSVDAYRSRWSLASDYPMVAPNYAQVRSQLALKVGLGRKRTTTDAENADDGETAGKPRNQYPPSRWAKPSD